MAVEVAYEFFLESVCSIDINKYNVACQQHPYLKGWLSATCRICINSQSSQWHSSKDGLPQMCIFDMRSIPPVVQPTCTTPSSQPRITSCLPILNLKGLSLSREESNFRPSVREPANQEDGERHRVKKKVGQLQKFAAENSTITTKHAELSRIYHQYQFYKKLACTCMFLNIARTQVFFFYWSVTFNVTNALENNQVQEMIYLIRHSVGHANVHVL